MILPAEQIDLIRSGQRDALLVPIEAGGASTPRTGAAVALQPAATARAALRVTVAAVDRLRLAELDDTHARRLGRDDVDELMAAWVETGRLWNEQASAWLVAFVREVAAPARLLHRDPARGYTTTPALAVAGEGEAVDEWVVEGYARAARERHRAHEEAERERRRAEIAARRARLTLEQRFALAVRAAREQGVDVNGHLAGLDKRVEVLERRVGLIPRVEDGRRSAPAEAS